MVNMRVDYVNALAQTEGVTYDEAAAELDRQWYNVRDDAVRLVGAAMTIARNVYGAINRGRGTGTAGRRQ